jgi:ABC-type phosphate transport system auxiliary subunit
MINNRLWYVAIILFGGAGACASGTHAEQVRDGRVSQVDDASDVRERAIEAQAKLRSDGIKQHYAELKRAADTSEPGAQESAKQLEKSQDYAQFQSDAKERLDKVAVRLDAAQQKITSLGGREPALVKDGLNAARRDHKALEQELAKLDSQRSSDWEAYQNRLDGRISGLTSRVETLHDQIKESAVSSN